MILQRVHLYSGKEKVNKVGKMRIVFKNGDIKNYNKDQYTDYKYCGEVFAVIRNEQWIGIFSMDMVKSIEVE